MAIIEHKNITDPNIHEPKGAATALAGEVFVADGATSGEFKKITLSESVNSNGSTYGSVLTAEGGGAGPEFGSLVWKDIIGIYKPDAGGATAPSITTFKGTGIDAYNYGLNDAADFLFHIPHDYAVGTNLYFHIHWGHNGTNISGTQVWSIEATQAPRTAAAPFGVFSDNITNTIPNSATLNITNYPRYCHVVEEIQLSSSVPTASLLNTATLKPDSLVVIHIALTGAPTITAGTAPSSTTPFLFQADIHYQANLIGTKNKDPDFNA